MKDSYVWEKVGIDVTAHISTHLAACGVEQNLNSPYNTLLKPRSLLPNPWVLENAVEDLGVKIGRQADQVINAIFVVDLGMSKEYVSWFTHTEDKTYAQTLLDGWMTEMQVYRFKVTAPTHSGSPLRAF
jgi:hypothetical protein